MPIPLPLVRFLIRTGIAQRLPSINRLTHGGAAFLHYYSDRVLMAPNTEVAATEALFASRDSACIDLSLGAPEFHLGEGSFRKLSLHDAATSQQTPNAHCGYPSPFGLPKLREAVAARFQRDHQLSYAADREVLITSGVCQGITMVLETFVNPGDAVVVLDPSFMFYHYSLRWQGARIRWVPTHVVNGETIFDLRDLRKALRGAKLILVNTPSNPTGACLSRESLEAIVGLAHRYDVLIFSDEVYERFLYDQRRFLSIAAIPAARSRTIVANSFSKGYALASLRVGYLAGPQFLMRPMMIHQFVRAPFVSTLCQEIALAALQQPDSSFAPVLGALETRRQTVQRHLAAMGFNTELPAGAFYYWMDVGRFASRGLEFCQRLLREQRVLLMPGEDFGPSGKRCVRISYAAEDQLLEEGLRRLGDFIASCRPRTTSSPAPHFVSLKSRHARETKPRT